MYNKFLNLSEKSKNSLFWLGFILSNLMSLFLVFRSSPFMISMGVIRRVFVGSSRLLIPMVYVFFLLVVISFSKRLAADKNIKTKLIALLVAVLALVVIFSLFYFNYQDLIHYSNYSFSRYYIFLPSLKFYANFQVLMLVVGFVSYWIFSFNKWKKVLTINNISFLIVVSLLPLIIFNILVGIPSELKDELYIFRTFVLKNNRQIPDFQSLRDELDFITSNTPPTATIIHPTQSNEFPIIGNQPLIRHGLFPRTLISAKYATDFLLQINNQTDIYYMLSVSYDPTTRIQTIFPNYQVNTSEILILYFDGSVRRVDKPLYVPELVNNLGQFDIGLIKLK
ncbi:TPA: hypothetical protein DIU22_01520 [Candidatus Woesebacteria bacterium]|nr:hypothetical protein [Candidatus Woesebacteria bacterium]